MHLRELLLHLHILRALEEEFVPVLVGRRRRTSTNHIQDVLGGVCVFLTLDAAPLLKVADERHRVLARVPKVHCLATLLQQQQPVELVKELTTRLVDRTQNRLALARQLLQETHNRPCRLRVQTRRRLVQEQQQTRLRRQLHTNRKTLALLHIQTLADLADERLGKRLHLEQLNDRLDIRNTLFLGRLARLAE